jgi:predicted transport protein
MSEETSITRYFCNGCGRRTKHFVRAEHHQTEDHDVVSYTTHVLIVECCGCENLAFVKRTHFSEDYDHEQDPATGETFTVPVWDEAIYPPVTYRAAPSWFEDLPDPTLKKISEEIYKSLQSESHYLATFGSRTLLDRLIVLTVGDKGNFPKGLQALMDEGKISLHERDILQPILQAGHAAAHRGWAPTKDQFKTIMDTIEGLIHRLLVLPKLAEELEEAVPTRLGRTAQLAGTKISMKEKIAGAPQQLRASFDQLDKFLRSLGEDVSVHPQKHYIAYKRGRNFASAQVYNQKKIIRVYLNIDPDDVVHGRPGIRDVRQIGHFGTGDLEVTIKSQDDIEAMRDLFSKSYEAS